MRKITEKAVTAFLAGKTCNVGNTSTDGKILRLHGNRIAEVMPDGSIVVTLADWPTPTTRERLNGLCRLLGLDQSFWQQQYFQFYGSRNESREIGRDEEVVLVMPGGHWLVKDRFRRHWYRIST